MFAAVKPHRSGRFCVLGLALALALSFSLQAKPIKLRTGTIEPRNAGGGLQNVPQTRNEPALYLVQLRDDLPRDWRAQVQRMGAQILKYVPDDTFVMRLPPQSVGRIRLMPFVEWVGDYLPEHKLHPQLAANLAAAQIHHVSVLLSRNATPAEVNAGRAAFSALRQQSKLPFG